jgi:2-C-methyl-D-erythritol 4-phosphate cytidylyltransferase
MGGDLPKQFIPVCGKPVLMHTIETFNRWDAQAKLVVVLPEAHREYWDMLCRELDCRIAHQVVAGGETRFHSVRNGLRQMTDCEIIGVHDGVRPFVSAEVVEACFDMAERRGAVAPVVPVEESIRFCDGRGNHAVNRADYCIVQTPQVFRAEILLDAYNRPYTPDFTDDASVVEASGITVSLVESNRENIKITSPADLAVAEYLIASKRDNS